MGRARKAESAPTSADDSHSGRFRCDDDYYFRWLTSELFVGDRRLALVSKPGVPAFGELDPSEGLLLDNIDIATSDRICSLQCGSGAVGTLAALRAPGGRVWMTDHNLVSVESARRTLEANEITNAEVTFGNDDEKLRTPFADVATIRLPKGRTPILQSIRNAYRALRPGGRCYIAGGNDEGIKPALKHLATLFGDAAVIAHRSGHRLGFAIRPDSPATHSDVFDTPSLSDDYFHNFPVSVRGITFEVFSRPGVFSWERLDGGTQALLDVVDMKGATRILDLGCGMGVVGVAAALQAPAAHVTMVDANAEAVRSSTRTVSENGLVERCEVLSSDVAAAVADRTFDVVLTNPPFHTGKATDLDVPAQFIRDAKRVLTPGGKFYLVANRTLPYEAWLNECFGSHNVEHNGQNFKVLSATRR